MKLTAVVFQERYGDLVSELFSQYTTARTLRVALSERKPPIIVTDGMLKMWYHGFHSASRPPAVQWGRRRHFLNFRSRASIGTPRRRQFDGGALPSYFPRRGFAKVSLLKF